MARGKASEHHAAAELAARDVGRIPDAARCGARSVEPRNRTILGVDDARVGVDLRAAEGVGDAATAGTR